MTLWPENERQAYPIPGNAPETLAETVAIAREQYAACMAATRYAMPLPFENGANPWVIVGKFPDGKLDIRVGVEEVSEFFREAGKAEATQ